MTKIPLLNISVVGIGNVINSALGLLFLTSVAKTLSIDDFGKYALLTTLLVAIGRLIDFGSNSIFVARSIKEDQDLSDTFLTLKTVQLLATFPIAFAVLEILELNHSNILLLFLLGLLAYGVNFTLFAIYQKVEKFHFAVGLNTVPALIKGGFAVLILLGIINVSLLGAFCIFSLAMFSSSIFVFWVPKEFRTFNFTRLGTKELFTEAIPAGLSITYQNGEQALANSVAKLARGFTDVGVLSIAEKIASIFAIVSLSIFTVLLPENARLKKERKQNIKSEVLFLASTIMFMALGAIIISNIAFPIVFGAKFADSINLLAILIIASAVTAIHTFMDSYFFVEEKTKILFTVSVSKLATFIGVSLILVPVYSITGLAYAQLLAALVALFITTTALSRV